MDACICLSRVLILANNCRIVFVLLDRYCSIAPRTYERLVRFRGTFTNAGKLTSHKYVSGQASVRCISLTDLDFSRRICCVFSVVFLVATHHTQP